MTDPVAAPTSSTSSDQAKPPTIEARLDAIEAAVKALEAAKPVVAVAADPKMAADLAEVVAWMGRSHGVGR